MNEFGCRCGIVWYCYVDVSDVVEVGFVVGEWSEWSGDGRSKWRNIG